MAGYIRYIYANVGPHPSGDARASWDLSMERSCGDLSFVDSAE